VAMLAFLGHLASINAGHQTIIAFGKPLFWFVQGVFFATFATGLVYFSRWCDRLYLNRDFEAKDAVGDNKPDIAKQKSDSAKFWKRMWGVVNTTTILGGTYALLCFVFGCYIGFCAFEILGRAHSP
jgi:hypothetical protein